jgi:hypothetical protein
MRDRNERVGNFIFRGSNYETSSGQEITVMRKGFFKMPEDSVSAVRISKPYVEHKGIDGNKRRVRIYEQYDLTVYTPFDEKVDNDEVTQSSSSRVDTSFDTRDFIRSLDSDYRPVEPIKHMSGSLVELKLKHGPNWRTEHETTLTNPDTKLAHIAAKRFAGVSIEEKPYTVETHHELMFILEALYVSKTKGRRPDDSIIYS